MNDEKFRIARNNWMITPYYTDDRNVKYTITDDGDVITEYGIINTFDNIECTPSCELDNQCPDETKTEIEKLYDDIKYLKNKLNKSIDSNDVLRMENNTLKKELAEVTKDNEQVIEKAIQEGLDKKIKQELCVRPRARPYRANWS